MTKQKTVITISILHKSINTIIAVQKTSSLPPPPPKTPHHGIVLVHAPLLLLRLSSGSGCNLLPPVPRIIKLVIIMNLPTQCHVTIITGNTNA
jgi:hypothetical protein